MTTSSASNSVFWGFFKKQKLIGPNFIDWYRKLRIVLSIEDTLNYLEQPIPPALVHPKEQELLQTTQDFHSCKQKEGQSVSSMGKTITEFHAMLKLHEQTLPKNNAPALYAIRAGHWKRNYPQYLSELLKKKKLKLKPGDLSLYVGNGQREAVKAIGVFYLCLPIGLEIVLNNCHYAPSITRGVISVSCLYEDGFINRFVNNIIQVSRNIMVSFSTILRDGIYEIDLSNSYTNDSYMYVVNNKRAKLDSDSALLWHCRLGHISKKRIKKLQHDGLLNLTDLRAFEKYVFFWGCEALVNQDTLTKPDKLEPRSIKCIFIGYPKETICYSFYYPPENKVLVAQNAEFLKNSLITQEASRSLEDLVIIQEEDTHPSIDTNLNHEEEDQEFDEPQSDINPIRRSTRTHRLTDCMCLYIDAEEYELRDLGETANSKAALLDPDKWLFKKRTDMDGAVHTYKAHLVVKGYTQTLRIDYKETFSPVTDIRAIRILIAIVAFYDYDILKMNVKTTFLNGCLSKEVYIEQLEDWICLFVLNGGAVDWKSAKQSIFATSSAEAEYIVAFDASKEAVGLENSFLGLVLFPQLKNP
nr:hypothetical protein [Tanacetum cinerariifolium]